MINTDLIHSKRSPMLEDLFSYDPGVSGPTFDLLTGQFLADGVPMRVAQAYAAIYIEAKQNSATPQDFFIKKGDDLELTLIGLRAINSYRGQTSQMGIRHDQTYTTLAKQSVIA